MPSLCSVPQQPTPDLNPSLCASPVMHPICSWVFPTAPLMPNQYHLSRVFQGSSPSFNPPTKKDLEVVEGSSAQPQVSQNLHRITHELYISPFSQASRSAETQDTTCQPPLMVAQAFATEFASKQHRLLGHTKWRCHQ